MTADHEHATEALETVLAEIDGALHRVSPADVDALVDRLVAATRVFVTGEGRSGLMGKAFAMRLMHLGLQVYVVGETITPSLADGDTLVAISGSGSTGGTVRVAEQAAAAGAAVVAVTTDAGSALAGVAERTLLLPAATKNRRAGEMPTVQPLSSLFDQVSHVSLDVVCLLLAERRKVGNDAARRSHSNTE